MNNRYPPGTQIEIINPLDPDHHEPKHVLFDFDGTLSLIRKGWPDVMVPMTIELLQETGTEETEAELRIIVNPYKRVLVRTVDDCGQNYYIRGDYTAGEHNRYDTKNRGKTPAHIENSIISSIATLLPSLDALIIMDQVEGKDCAAVTNSVREFIAVAALRLPM